MLNSITEDQAENSNDLGCDSDAEDNFSIDINASSTNTRSRFSTSEHISTTLSSVSNNNSSLDSDVQNIFSTSREENIRVLHPVKTKQSLHFSSSSLSDIDDNDAYSDVCMTPASTPILYSSSDSNESCVDNSQPDDANTFSWNKKGKEPSTYNGFKFKEAFGVNGKVNSSEVLNYFEMFLNIIVNESNLYATQSNTYLNLTVPELKAVIGILIIMGLNVLPNMRLYWSDDDNFHNSKIASIMTVNAFFK